MSKEQYDNNCDTKALSASPKRISWIDVCKGITIILIILGHINSIPYTLRCVIFSFHIPLFMMISGYLIHTYDVRQNFIESIKSLLVPYAIIGFLEAVFAVFFSIDVESAGTALFHSLNEIVISMSNGSGIFMQYGSVGVIWLISCLFISKKIYIAICSVCRHMPWIFRILVILGCSCSGVVIGQTVGFLPWSLDVAMTSVIFLAVGDFLHHNQLSKTKNVLILCVSLFCWILLLNKGIIMELSVRSYPKGALCFVCAIAGSFTMITVTKVIDKIPGVASFFSWAGQNFMILLGVHCLEIRFFKWNEWIYTPLHLSLSWITTFILHAFVIILISYALIKIMYLLSLLNNKLKQKHGLQPAVRRIDWADVAKGLCIISIILGHLGVSWLNQIVFIYHIPVFYIIAGYFFKKADELPFAKAKARRLLVPYAVTSMIMCILAVFRAFFEGTSKKEAIFHTISAALYGAGDSWETPFRIYAIGAIWFLLALFIGLLITNYCFNYSYYRILIISIAFIGWASFDVSKVWLPFSLQAGMLATVYLLIGYECRKNNFSISRIGLIPLIGLFLFTAFGIQYFKGIWLVHNYYGNGLLDFFVTIAASIVIIAISQLICQKSEWLKSILTFYGHHSLVILCAHIIDLNVLKLATIATSLSNYLRLNNNHSLILLIIIRITYVTVIAAISVLFHYLRKNISSTPKEMHTN